MDDRKSERPEDMRRRAEAMARILASGAKARPQDMSPDEAPRLIHDLQVHQIELEMQNEELRRTQVELELAQSRYFDLFDVAPVGYVVMEETGLVTEVNLTTSAMLGHPRADMVAQPFTRYIARQDQDRFYLQRKRLLETGAPMSCDLRLLKQDGTSFWAHLEATVARTGDGTMLCRAVLSDISDRKGTEAQQEKLQARLSRTEKMESVGRLAEGVAHDFNNMLAVIIGNVELALGQVDPGGSLHGVLQEVHKAARRSADATRQLFAFTSRRTDQPQVLDLNAAIGGTVLMLQRLLGEDIHLRWTPGPDLWLVEMDPSQLEQILANLCLNARSAIADVGEICIETGNATLDASRVREQPGLRPGDFVRLVVSDNGSGMDEATAAHIFEPFFTIRDTDGGNGPGLDTVHAAIVRNGGLIDIDTRPGRGTTFFIYLPRCQAATALVPVHASVAPVALSPGTVLLVEDEPALLDMATSILERQGYGVLAAGTPEAAIRLATERTGPIDLLMTDVVMPGMNGRDLAAALRKLRPQLRCLFMSGYSEDIITQHGAPEPGRQFLQKPFSPEDLLARVREALAD